MIFYSLFDLYRLRRNQWLKTSELEEIQRRKLRRIIMHAYKNVKYYRKLFDSAGVKPEDIKTVEDLSKIPITTRKQLQQLSLDEIVAKGVNLAKCKEITTGGSSGVPLKVIISENDFTSYGIIGARASLENGQRLWHKAASFKFHISHKRWFQHLGIWRKEVISILDDPMKRIEDLKRIKPDVIRGNPFEIVSTARFMKENGIEGINPRLIFSLGSVLDESSRELINSTFKTKMFDYYAMTELGCMAWECMERQGYHINIDAVVMELIKEDRRASPDEKGRIVCTGLHSFVMPFIRYDTGDIGILSDERCPCGRGLPMLKSVEGRADDFLISADDIPISPSVIVNQMKLIPGIAQFKIVQENKGEILVWFVADKNFSHETESEIKRLMRKIMGNNVNIEVKAVNTIPPDSSGKIRSLVSKVKADRNF